MKKSLFASAGARLSALIALASLLESPPDAIAQERPPWGPGEGMTQAIAKVMSGARIARSDSYGYDRDVSVMGAFVASGGVVAMSRTLVQGEQYVFLGGGDEGVADMDIIIKDPRGALVAADAQRDASPVVKFKPRKTGDYTIEVKLPRAPRGGFCALAILRFGGYEVPIPNLVTAMEGITSQGRAANDEMGGTVFFHAQPNQWALFGAILKPGEETVLNNLYLERAAHVFFAAGDASARVIDLFLLKNGRVVANDDGEDAKPIIIGRTTPGVDYGLRLRNTRSDGISLVVATILDMRLAD